MDALKKWMISHFTPHQTTTLPKRLLFRNLFFNSTLLLNGWCSIQVRPPSSSDDLCLLFCIYPSSKQRDFFSRYEMGHTDRGKIFSAAILGRAQQTLLKFQLLPSLQQTVLDIKKFNLSMKIELQNVFLTRKF